MKEGAKAGRAKCSHCGQILGLILHIHGEKPKECNVLYVRNALGLCWIKQKIAYSGSWNMSRADYLQYRLPQCKFFMKSVGSIQS